MAEDLIKRYGARDASGKFVRGGGTVPAKRMGSVQSRRRALTIMSLRMQDVPPSEIKRRLGLSDTTYARIVRKLRKPEQWVEDSRDRLDTYGVPIAVDNAIEGLKAKDKVYTLKVLEGRGILFPQNAEQRTLQQPFMVKIVQPDGGEVTVAAAGSIVGTPNRR